MAGISKNNPKYTPQFAARTSWTSQMSLDDLKRLIGEFQRGGSLSEIVIERHVEGDGDSDDEVEKDGGVSSKAKKPPNIKTVHEHRFTSSMVLTSLPSPVAKGECIMFQDDIGSTDVIEITSGERYLEATDDDVDMPTKISEPDDHGKFQRKAGPDGLCSEAPFYLHNVCPQANFVVMVLDKNKAANLESHTWDEITQMQDQNQGVYSLISMWNTDHPNQAQMTTALFFNLQQGGESYNYYLEPHDSDVVLTKVRVTGLAKDALAQENSKHLFFAIETAAFSTGVDAVDAGVCTGDNNQQHFLSQYLEKPNGSASTQLSHFKKFLSPERPDSGLGSLQTSFEDS